MPGPRGGLSEIDRLKNAAISAAMAEDRLYGDSPSIGYREGTLVQVNSDGILRWGDGEPMDPGYDYTGDWELWRGAIDSLVAPWEDRPTLGPFHDKVEALRTAAEKLRPGTEVEGDGTDSGVVPGGELRAAISSLHGDLAGMQGQTIWAFRTRYVDHLHTINEGQFGLAYVLGQCVAAEQAIWDKADLDYRDLISQGSAAFLAARDYQLFGSGGGDYSTELKVAGAILAGIGLFASGGLATAVGVAGFGVSLLEGFAPSGDAPKPTITGGSANEVLESLSKALDELRDAIQEQESAILECLDANLAAVEGSPDKFDLASPALLTKDHPDQIGFAVDQTTMRLCGNQTCPRVARGFTQAATAAEGGLGSGPWTRPSYFGATYGSYATYERLLNQLRYAAENTGYEITKAGRLLALSADYFDNADGNAQEALAEIERLVRTYEEDYPDNPNDADPSQVVDGWAMSMGGPR